MRLKWDEIGLGVLYAVGDDHAYLITCDDHRVVLTRWAPRPNETGTEVAAQVALNTIAIVARGESYQATAVSRFRAMAAQFERGEDVFAQPRWAHERT